MKMSGDCSKHYPVCKVGREKLAREEELCSEKIDLLKEVDDLYREFIGSKKRKTQIKLSIQLISRIGQYQTVVLDYHGESLHLLE